MPPGMISVYHGLCPPRRGIWIHILYCSTHRGRGVPFSSLMTGWQRRGAIQAGRGEPMA